MAACAASRSVYSASRAFLAASAAAAALANVLAVLLLFTVWWHLGCVVLLSALELARLFGAPLLAGTNSNAERAQLARAVGRTHMLYGAVATVKARATGYNSNHGGGGGRMAEGLAGKGRSVCFAWQRWTAIMKVARGG